MVTLISGAHGIFPYLQTGLLCGGVESAAIETAVNIAHILNERPLPGSAVATPNGVNWAFRPIRLSREGSYFENRSYTRRAAIGIPFATLELPIARHC